MTPEDVTNLKAYLCDSLETDKVRVEYGEKVFFQIPAHLAIEAGAAISAFFVDQPEMAPTTHQILDHLMLAHQLHQRFPSLENVMGFFPQ